MTRLPEHIEAGDLAISLWTPDDETAMHQLISDSLDHLRPWMAWAHTEPLSPVQRQRLLARWRRYWESGDGAIYAIRVAGELVGGCALHRRVGPGGVDLGYWLGRHATGRGLAVRTARALTEAAFVMPDISFVQISHSADNTRSGAVPLKLGFANVTPSAEVDATIWRLDRDS